MFKPSDKQITSIHLTHDVLRAMDERLGTAGGKRSRLVELALRKYLGMPGTTETDVLEETLSVLGDVAAI